MAQSGSALENQQAPRRGRKYFTLSEAKRALTLVRRIAQDIRMTQAERLRLHAAMSAGASALASERQQELQEGFDRESDRLDALVEELGKIGVDLKDRTKGLLDFPTLHEGREVLLCWMLDEDTITHWHEVDTGYAGRRPVSELHDAK